MIVLIINKITSDKSAIREDDELLNNVLKGRGKILEFKQSLEEKIKSIENDHN